jgi:hypothetical protein
MTAKRIQILLNQTEWDAIIAASKPVPYMIFDGVEPRSPQQNVNAVWKELGAAHGVVWDSFLAVDESKHIVSAIPLPEPNDE